MINIEISKAKDKTNVLLILYISISLVSHRNTTAKALYGIIDKSHVSIWKWMQKYKPKKKISFKRRRINEFIVDETQIKVGSQYIWLWIAIIEPKHRQILQLDISFERSMLVAERFLYSLIDKYDKHPISTDGCTWYPPQACRFLKLKHHLHSSFEKSIIERTIQHNKDRTDNLMTTFHAEKGMIVN